MRIKKIAIMFSALLITMSLFGQQAAVLPVHSNGIDQSTVSTFDQLLRQEIINATNYHIISKDITYEVSGDNYCMDGDCGADIGRSLNVDKVISCSLSKLGKKVVIQFMKVDVATSSIEIIDSVVSASLEDLDAAAKRIAVSISTNKSISQTAQVGNVMKKEETSYMRRKARQYNGLSFGYVYPSHGYDNINNEFTIDGNLGFETERMAVGMTTGFRRGFLINVFAHYLTTKTDFCPYLGGAVGFHWVNHDYRIKGYEEDGIELTFSTGIKFFRTYNFQVRLNIDYSVVLNEYHDEGLAFTIGLLK